MKNLKILMSATLLALFAINAGAQGIGIRAGVNFQNINGKNFAGGDLENDLTAGFNVGVLGEIPIAPDFYFQPGLHFSTKGAKSNDLLIGETFASSLKIGYIEVPLHVVHKPLLGTGHLILGLGPYVGFGLTGNAKVETGGVEAERDVEFKSTVEPSDPDDVMYLRRFDAGANLFAGYEFANGLSFQLNTQLGLLNIRPEYSGLNDQSKWNNTGFGLSVGYRFR